MGKNWLIRTKSNHILGPVSKDKVVELYRNGSIKADDEVCSGNGYWFFIRESDLVDKYLLGSQTQSFNPISEAKDVLTSTDAHASSGSKEDITMIGKIDLAEIQEISIPVPKEAQLSSEVELVERSQKKKIKTESILKKSVNTKSSQIYLKYLGYFVLIILILLIYFRKSILKTFFSDNVSYFVTSWVVAQAHAQDEGPAKKKSF